MMVRKNNIMKESRQRSAQATLEFTFAMIVAILLLIGMIQAIVWVAKDLVKRKQAHEQLLTDESLPGWEQTRPTFYTATSISSTVRSDVFGNVQF